MAIHYQISYTSRLARHRHILWTDDQYADSQISVPDYENARVLNIPLSSFNQTMAPLKYGRFYPAQILKAEVNPRAAFFRVTGINAGEFTADFNHPLAGKDVTVEQVALQSEYPSVGEPRMLLEWAGIDAPLNEQDTDYSIPHAFDREDSTDDAVFYENPRKVIHVDQTCVSHIKALYADLVKPEDSVLDLMSSWRSHLPEITGKVAGLGMNAEEMADNPQLQSHIVYDLNRSPNMPFKAGDFDVVINTVSIEYLSEPLQVLSEVRRVLRPGGLVIITFSNRYFPPKTTRLWIELHPVERLGWVLQLLEATGFSNLHCQVERGLRRSQDDRYAHQVEGMDPLFAAWGTADMI